MKIPVLTKREKAEKLKQNQYNPDIIKKMSFVIHRKPLLFNYDPVEIKVEFIVIHYTAAGLSKTLNMFQDPKTKASSHLVVDQDGVVYELVSCLKGGCFKAWHAGDSYWKAGGKDWRKFNDFSIGVELVNKNGNLFEYTKEQYQSLKQVLTALKAHYKNLKNPERVVGHEHIAGFRGKVDPGYFFDWSLFFEMNYCAPFPSRKAVLSEKHRRMFFKSFDSSRDKEDEYWIQCNSHLEDFYLGQVQKVK